MAVTLKTRAGSALKARIRLWEPGKVQLTNTDGYTARLQLRSAGGSQRVLLSTQQYDGPDPAPAGTVLQLVESGHWRLFLGSSITKTLPPQVRLELELVNDLDSDDTVPLMSGTIYVEPQAVTND